ncbi:MAG TPA: lysophospholipid acyltransferase family protein [Tepidisphaeraceae bacterium]|nr:lysophospholipid acyltransferase family protein [Tepidisphaeraceae bacterium]
MAKPRNDLIDRLQYVGLRLVSMMLHTWPLDLNLAAARLLGDVMYVVDKRHRERALGNLRRSFPDMPEPVRREMARESMRQMFLLAVEVLFTTRLVQIPTFAKYIDVDTVSPVLGLMMGKHHGVIMLTGHYGNWEILGYAFATLGFETTSVARPLDNPYINEWMLGVRERRGQKIIGKKGATDDVLKTLDQKGAVGFIADQNAGPKGIFVDFFGRKASTYKSIGLLAMEREVPIIVGYARRVGKGFRFRLGMSDLIWPKDWKDEPDPLRYITQRYTAAIEKFVREDPGQYLWVHRRWKTRPKGEEPEKYD